MVKKYFLAVLLVFIFSGASFVALAQETQNIIPQMVLPVAPSEARLLALEKDMEEALIKAGGEKFSDQLIQKWLSEFDYWYFVSDQVDPRVTRVYQILQEGRGLNQKFNRALITVKTDSFPHLDPKDKGDGEKRSRTLRAMNAIGHLGIYASQSFIEDKRVGDEQILVVMAHELGHDKNDMARNFIIEQWLHDKIVTAQEKWFLRQRIEERADQKAIELLAECEQKSLKVGDKKIQPKMLFDTWYKLFDQGRMSQAESLLRVSAGKKYFDELKKRDALVVVANPKPIPPNNP